MLTILFFARLKEQLGQASLTIELSDSCSVQQLVERLITEKPQWQAHLTNVNILCAVNQNVVDKDFVVNAGDEVAFFPPVTGG